MIFARITNPFGRRLRSTVAFTLVEVLWAAVLIATGVTATVKAVNGAKNSSLSSQRSTEASKIASAELEALKSYSYKSLGMTGNITGSSTMPTGDCPRFQSGSAGSYSSCPTGSTVATAMQIKVNRHNDGTAVTEELVEPQNGGIDGDATTNGAAGLVPTTPKNVTVGGSGEASNFKVFRYVTWHDEVCDYAGDNTLTTEDDCAGKRNTKTLLVGVEPRDRSGGPINPGEPGPNTVLWVSAVVANPAEGAAGGGCSGAACGTSSRLYSQKFFLYDTTCDKSSRQNQTTSHATHLTTAQAATGWSSTTKNVSACKNTSPPSGSDCRFPGNDPWTTYAEASTKSDSRCLPDLMAPQPPPVASENEDPASPFRYNGDVYATAPTSGAASESNWPQLWGYGPASSLLQRTAGCPSSAPPTNTTGGSSVNAASIHTWATDELSSTKFVGSSQKGFYVAGRMAINFWVSTYDPAGTSPTGKGKLCITLIDRDEGTSTADPWANDRIIYQFACEVAHVPLGTGPHWSTAQARSNNTIDRRVGKRLPVRRNCRFQPGYGLANWAKNYVTSAKSQVFPPPVADPAAPNAAYGAPPCQKTSGGGPGIIDYDSDGYDDYGYLVCNGHRLLVRISVVAPDATALGTNGAEQNIALYYDHESVPSNIEIATLRKTQFK